MLITVQLFGTLRRLANTPDSGSWAGDVPCGTTIRKLIHIIGTTENEIAVASVNGKKASFDTEIGEYDTIVLVTPIGGG
jgi:molybdopterin converting factor small subunit